MIEIPLSKKGKHAGKYVAIVDDCDADLAELNWKVSINSRTDGLQYAARRVGMSAPTILMHRVIMERMTGRLLATNELADHINHNGLDNRRENLRIATHAQNQHNRNRSRNTKQTYRGVRWDGRQQKWVAKIKLNRKYIHIGAFDDELKAYEAYCEKADELYGEFANYESVEK